MTTLLTGASGFLGPYLVAGLEARSEIVLTLGRSPANDLRCDLGKAPPDLGAIPGCVSWVVHAAGRAHVEPRTAEERSEMYRVNLEGTQNLLRGLDAAGADVKSLLFISSVAVYGLSSGRGIEESAALMGRSAYAKSKIAAEECLREWAGQRGVTLGILRLPLVVGRNPIGNLGAMVRALERGVYFRVGRGAARRSMVLAEDVAKVLPVVLDKGGVYNLTDGYHPTLFELEEAVARRLERGPVHSVPYIVARAAALVGDAVQSVTGRRMPLTSDRLGKLTNDLTFDHGKAVEELDWSPRPVVDNLYLYDLAAQ